MSVYEYEVKTIRGEKKTLAEYAGQVLLIVNTATKCGFAPQFRSLQQLHDKYGPQGFAVLGFPCSQFANQEMEDNQAIEQACELNFGVSFPLFARIDVKGPGAHPLFNYLSDNARGVLGSKSVKWNFTKFLVNREGHVVKRFAPNETPDKIVSDLERLLAEPKPAQV
ncbi:glutathione peroxidase [Paenibacillus sp. M1]|uniref:Glutathione peroxidase n=1 Tax=Paenibacillus haidiansis TaxID=1574488 RepID=A0ABU7VPJ6_9BACL